LQRVFYEYVGKRSTEWGWENRFFRNTSAQLIEDVWKNSLYYPLFLTIKTCFWEFIFVIVAIFRSNRHLKLCMHINRYCCSFYSTYLLTKNSIPFSQNQWTQQQILIHHNSKPKHFFIWSICRCILHQNTPVCFLYSSFFLFFFFTYTQVLVLLSIIVVVIICFRFLSLVFHMLARCTFFAIITYL
jgi:hypothetical protein